MALVMAEEEGRVVIAMIGEQRPAAPQMCMALAYSQSSARIVWRLTLESVGRKVAAERHCPTALDENVHQLKHFRRVVFTLWLATDACLPGASQGLLVTELVNCFLMRSYGSENT